MSDEWVAATTYRIGDEIRRLRGKRSGQWVSDRTDQLGHRVSRSTISEIETHRRGTITVTDLIVLARALNTAPIALIYPPPYTAVVEMLPDMNATNYLAAEWFSAKFDDEARGWLSDDVDDYDQNLQHLRNARTAADLAYRKLLLIAAFTDSDAGKPEAREKLAAEIADLQQRIHELNRASDGG